MRVGDCHRVVIAGVCIEYDFVHGVPYLSIATSVWQNAERVGSCEDMNNRQRITLACFLAYFVMSSMLAPIGIISTPLAGHYGLTVSAMTEQFSALPLGILVGAIAALFLPTRRAFRLVFAGRLLALSVLLVSRAWLRPLQLFTLALGGVGVGCGIGLAAAATTFSRLYDGNL